MVNGGMNVDSDGFLVSDTPAVKAPPQTVRVPAFFSGCGTIVEAAIKALNELNKPYSVQLDGQDEMYRRLSNALIVLLADKIGLTP